MTKQVMELFNYSGIKAGKEHAIIQALLDHLKAQPILGIASEAEEPSISIYRRKVIAMLERELGTKEENEPTQE